MKWEQLLYGYLGHVQVLGCRADKLQSIIRWTSQFVWFCQQEGLAAPGEVTASHIARYEQDLLWRRSVRGHFYAPTTVDMALRTIRSWMRWAHAQGHVLLDPTADLVLRRPPKPLHARLLSVAEVELLLESVDESIGGLRDRAVLETFYGTAVRLLECHKLDVGDVDLRERMLYVRHGKNGTQRLVPIGEVLAEALDRWLREGRPEYLRRPDEPALFLSLLGARLSYGSMQAVVARAARRAGFGFSVRPHALRHACATHMLEGGADLFSIGRLLGHTNPRSTSLYTHLSPHEVFQTHQRTHPRAQRTSATGTHPDEA